MAGTRAKQEDLKRVNVHLSQSQLEELDQLATETTIPRNTQIRMAVAKYLAAERRKAARA